MLDSQSLRQLLDAVASGQMTPDQVLSQLQFAPFEGLGFSNESVTGAETKGFNTKGFDAVGDFAFIDHHRRLRTGFPEAIWGSGKTSDQIVTIMRHMQARGSLALATRITPEAFANIQSQLPEAQYSTPARICWVGEPSRRFPGRIHILSAGTADLPVAEEAALTAELSGFEVRRLWDVGVAGLHRLLHHRDVIATADVLIVVAGMEGALASIVGGLADCPVVAVPTSIGYGASFNGLAALLAMLNACAAGIGVVNIDNGFGAAILAAQILRTGTKLAQRGTERI